MTDVNAPASLSPFPKLDPRTVPVVAVDAQLPAVPASALTPAALRERFARALDWTPEIRRELSAMAGEAAPAAVLLPNPLTQREMDVLQWVACGKTNRDVAEILGMSPRTVNKHLEHIYEKLGVETRTAAVAQFARLARP